MASKQQLESLRGDLICPICLDLFTDPVSPDCGHNSCRSYITQLGQSQYLQSHIRSLFAELHQILFHKEQRLLKYLSDEKEMILNTMEKNIQEIQVRLNLTQQELPILQKQLGQVNGVTLFQEVAGRKRRFSVSLRSPADSVTLDLETACWELDVSEDRRSVMWTGTQRSPPDNGKRFTIWPCVLGSEGFTSGRRYWEVEVTENWGWCLGVAAKSMDRERDINLRQVTGLWSVEQVGDEFHVNSSPKTHLLTDPIPEWLGVYLSYEAGIVSFYSAVTKSHLHTFSGNRFTGKIYPFFWTWDGNQCLRICSGSILDL
ncbi:E3 ubiquitin-protein ligase TRIM11-like [Leucoraja erinacea]|uniref:E3 ubiquitin-protein ligase TRIM11-like n=1 Tax=Leucoraja erinaceus TaxID=7782 RepID=UPI00245411E2|nr:E3 ubiquitin-protein ligase TRIM11-like [Leucoraja erinacea]